MSSPSPAWPALEAADSEAAGAPPFTVVEAADAAEVVGRARAAALVTVLFLALWPVVPVLLLVATGVIAGISPGQPALLAVPPGWVPLDLTLRFLHTPASTLDWIQRGQFALAMLAFAITAGTSRTALRAMRVAEFRWSPGWTMASVFIPLLCFYRPWAGLAEIRRAAYRGAAGDAGGTGARWSFSGATLALGLGGYACLAAGGTAIGFTSQANPYASDYMVVVQSATMVLSGTQAAFSLLFSWYALSLVGRVHALFRRLATAVPPPA